MADKRYLRSPITIAASRATALSAVGVLNIDGTDRYTLSANLDSNNEGFFEISELCRDYLTLEFAGTYSSYSIDVEFTVTYFDAVDGGGNTVGSAEVTDFYGVDGYTYYEEGSNVVVTGTPKAQSNLEVYLPDNTAGKIPTFSSTGFTYNAVTATQQTKTIGSDVFTINRFCVPKYTAFKVTFVNKFGAFQDMWFTMKRIDTMGVSKENYKANMLSSTGGYTVSKHARQTYNTSAVESFVLNTDYIKEDLNSVIEELLQTEQCWILENSQTIPVVPRTSSLQFKTSLNDQLIQYTVEFDYAFDKINNIR
jgi:hypothetical protein